MSLNCSVWRLLVVHKLEEACRLPVRVQKQQAQKLGVQRLEVLAMAGKTKKTVTDASA